jgi:hypothetical protein
MRVVEITKGCAIGGLVNTVPCAGAILGWAILCVYWEKIRCGYLNVSRCKQRGEGQHHTVSLLLDSMAADCSVAAAIFFQYAAFFSQVSVAIADGFC